jgi:penicillin-binding protein 1C
MSKVLKGVFAILVLGVIFLKVTRDPILQGTSFSQEIKAQDHQLLRLTLSNDDKYRIFRPLDQIHPELIQSVLLLEDQYFYYHLGVNPVSLFRALLTVNSNQKIGASTVTMQLVRLKYQLHTRSISGKLRQIIYALYYEILYSKDQILEAYLNLTPYGANIEGVEAASQIYFNKSADQLNLLESFTLAVIPQNPVKRNLNQTVQDQVKLARDRMIKKWLTENPESQNSIQDLKSFVLSSRILDLPFHAPHFVEEIIKRYPDKKYVHTTLDLNLQNKIDLQLKAYLKTTANRGVRNGSVLLIDTRQKAVKAWVGSGDFFDSTISGQVDGVNIPRSPGSTLKPFIYGQAMDEGLIHPQTLLKDVPLHFGSFDPENFDRRFLGPISSTQALVLSRNVPAIDLASKIKKDYLYDLLKKTNVENLISPEVYGLGLAIGTVPMTALNLGSLYSALANQGTFSSLQLTNHETQKASFQMISAESAFLVLDMLSKTARDHNSVLNDQMINQLPLAWKTGTSYGFRDAWTVGVLGPYVLVVWLGNFDYTSNPHLIGRDVAAPLFFQIADLFSPQTLKENSRWKSPIGLNIKNVEVCDVSGALPTSDCPHRHSSFFVPAVSPIETCQIHRKIQISKKSGLRLCGGNHQDSAFEVFEFWPTEFSDVFQKIGVRRRSVPQYDPSCGSQALDNQSRGPQILSPKKDLNYVISFAKQQSEESIPLQATADNDNQKLNWFINQKWLGQSEPQKLLFFKAKVGVYDVMVVDQQGRADHQKIEVKLVR